MRYDDYTPTQEIEDLNKFIDRLEYENLILSNRNTNLSCQVSELEFFLQEKDEELNSYDSKIEALYQVFKYSKYKDHTNFKKAATKFFNDLLDLHLPL